MSAASELHDGQHTDCPPCFVVKLRSLQVTPSASPAARRHGAPRTELGNAWERGPVTDHRGVQILKPDGNPLTRKELANRPAHYRGQFRQAAALKAANTHR